VRARGIPGIDTPQPASKSTISSRKRELVLELMADKNDNVDFALISGALFGRLDANANCGFY